VQGLTTAATGLSPPLISSRPYTVMSRSTRVKGVLEHGLCPRLSEGKSMTCAGSWLPRRREGILGMDMAAEVRRWVQGVTG
jgi:hypothetical protein